jgi:ATP-dependent DNA ligase
VGVRGLVVTPDRVSRRETDEDRRAIDGDAGALARWLRRLPDRLPLLCGRSVLDSELVAGRFASTMAALHGSVNYADRLRFVVFDVPVLAGVDLRALPWRDRLELLAEAFDVRSSWFKVKDRAWYERVASRSER